MRVADAPLIAPYAVGCFGGSPIRISNSHFICHSGARFLARTRNPEVLDCQAHHVEIPGSLAQGRKRPGMTDMVSRSRGAKRPRFATPSRTARGVERWEAPGVLR